ncbi:IclR family transcriptional regulator [Ideonella azotifigens]|uniref:IclR family transcriptional regulator n=1 Tax=Ideonella azotifigens TaxID=513160 RepID=A0ABP3VUH4_9BURK|nr:IclR family transcriptional regulator [Ideonella azotifigens]MCD2339162.1 IclR family transcriptional regulator [Ideonella azotifigens]
MEPVMPTDPKRTSPDKPGTSPANRSLERGVEILRAFRPGSDLLGNGELADRTGLSRATVSRLSQTLVGMGLLQQEPLRKGYRLAPAVLSLAHAMRSGSTILQVAAPLMRALAESKRINVGLAAPDRDEMVYLESIRYSRRVAFRNVVSGQRVPMELTSLGHAHLATCSTARRKALYEVFKARRSTQWPLLLGEIERSITRVRESGFCAASWQPEVVALATPVNTEEACYSLNVSVSTVESMEAVVAALSAPLLELRDAILSAMARRVNA